MNIKVRMWFIMQVTSNAKEFTLAGDLVGVNSMA